MSAHSVNNAAPPGTVIHSLDARRLLCPMPVIRLQDFVTGLPAGDVVEVICTDPGARSDIPAWCRISGHELIGIVERRAEVVVSIRVGELRRPQG